MQVWNHDCHICSYNICFETIVHQWSYIIMLYDRSSFKIVLFTIKNIIIESIISKTNLKYCSTKLALKQWREHTLWIYESHILYCMQNVINYLFDQHLLLINIFDISASLSSLYIWYNMAAHMCLSLTITCVF